MRPQRFIATWTSVVARRLQPARLRLQPARICSDAGVALITTLMVMALMSALMIGFSAVVMSDQRYRLIDRDRVRAFYGAHSGLEKLNADLANLFFVNVAPGGPALAALADHPPDIPDVIFTDVGNGVYGVTKVPLAVGEDGYGHITTGPYQGLLALKQRYDLDATVRTTGGGEAHLRRSVETVAIPVFQFGVFSSVDLSFHAGPNFSFGGRVHSNGNLFLAQNTNATLTLPERITAVGEVVRERLANGVLTSVSGHLGTVNIATAPGYFRNLANVDEGSVKDTVGAGMELNDAWTNLSLSAYNGYIRNGRTGARHLNLPLTNVGANTDLVRRPATANENTAKATLFGERMFSKVSLRILLSDKASDITNLPTIDTTKAPVRLDGNWATVDAPAGYGSVTAALPPIARSPGSSATKTNGNIVAGATTIALTSMPVGFMPAGGAMTLTRVNASGTLLGTQTITCSGRTAAAPTTLKPTFSGCTPVATGGANGTGGTRSFVSVFIDFVEIKTFLTENAVAGATTLIVQNTAANPIARFGNETYWVGDTLVSCTENNSTSLLGCTGTPAVPSGTWVSTSALSERETGTIGGFIKVEMRVADNITDPWRDVTLEILKYGISGRNLGGPLPLCDDPTPNAIIRLQRLRDNSGGCNYAGSTRSIDHWPNVLFDTREALARDVSPGGTTPTLGGVMHYVALDVRNLKLWLERAGPYAAGTGNQARSTNGYSVYFSDRRNNRDLANLETGEYGYEDIINPASATGVPNATLDKGEDVNANTTVETYGQFPSYNGARNALPPGSDENTLAKNGAASFGTATGIRPTTLVTGGQAKTNRAYLFRRALKLVNGARGNIPLPGLTIVAENPVYIQGDWNLDASGVGSAHSATSIIADAVTLLSSNWNDNNSFNNPYSTANRVRSAQSYYRFGVIAGKNAPFPGEPVQGNAAQDFGTDGGVHNFLRMLEDGGTVNYRGSIATFYFSRQAVGVYKTGPVYGAPIRLFNFDTDFLDPAKLPPLTPVFRDVNSLGFAQETRPGR